MPTTTYRGVGASITLDTTAGTITLEFSGFTTAPAKQQASPRTLPLGAIERVEYQPRTIADRGWVRLHLRNRDGYDELQINDLNAWFLKDKVGDFIDQLTAAVDAAEPINPTGYRLGRLGQLQLTADGLTYAGTTYPAAGAAAFVETADAAKSRMTATRVVAGAALLGPLGAVLGASARKSTGVVYLVVNLPSGVTLTEEVPVADIAKAHEMANLVNAAGAATPAAAPTPPPPPATPATWAPDPTGRHQQRWWDGTRWTEHVTTNGTPGTDPL